MCNESFMLVCAAFRLARSVAGLLLLLLLLIAPSDLVCCWLCRLSRAEPSFTSLEQHRQLLCSRTAHRSLAVLVHCLLPRSLSSVLAASSEHVPQTVSLFTLGCIGRLSRIGGLVC